MLIRKPVGPLWRWFEQRWPGFEKAVAKRQTANVVIALCDALEQDDDEMLGALHSGAVKARELRGLQLQHTHRRARRAPFVRRALPW